MRRRRALRAAATVRKGRGLERPPGPGPSSPGAPPPARSGIPPPAPAPLPSTPPTGPAPSRPATHRVRFPHNGGDIERREPRGRGSPRGPGGGACVVFFCFVFQGVPRERGDGETPSTQAFLLRVAVSSRRRRPAQPPHFRPRPANQRRPAPAPEARPAPGSSPAPSGSPRPQRPGPPPAARPAPAAPFRAERARRHSRAGRPLCRGWGSGSVRASSAKSSRLRRPQMTRGWLAFVRYLLISASCVWWPGDRAQCAQWHLGQALQAHSVSSSLE